MNDKKAKHLIADIETAIDLLSRPISDTNEGGYTKQIFDMDKTFFFYVRRCHL